MSPKIDDPDDEIMCSCSGTKRGCIQNLFEEGLDMDAISRRTGALSGCGGCEWDIEEFLRELSQKNKS
jgi:NAD(P)H-nitrite reductase large subunit